MEVKRKAGRPRIAERVETTPVYLKKSEIAILREKYGTISKAIRANVPEITTPENGVRNCGQLSAKGSHTPINPVQVQPIQPQSSHKPETKPQRYTIRPVVDQTGQPTIQVLKDDIGEWIMYKNPLKTGGG